MITFKKINLNRPYYFFSNMTNIMSIDKISYKNTDAVVYNINYIMMESVNNQSVDSENPLCLVFNDVDEVFLHY